MKRTFETLVCRFDLEIMIRKGPAVPRSPSGTKCRIVDVAEQRFTARGVADVSPHVITSEADVNLAAVSCHFGSELGLVPSILRDRGPRFAERRSA